MFLRTTIALLLSFFFSATYAVVPAFPLPENGLGTISGRIMGAMLPVSGAEIVLMDKDKVIDKMVTDNDGNYSFLYVRPGQYDIKSTKRGYRTSIIIKVPVTEDHTTKNDFYLPIINNAHMPNAPIVDNYEHNCKKYMRQK